MNTVNIYKLKATYFMVLHGATECTGFPGIIYIDYGLLPQKIESHISDA